MNVQTYCPKRSTPLLAGTLKNLFYPPEKSEYEYFSRASSAPFAGSDNIVKAAWAADAAMLSYARYGPTRMSDDELTDHLSQAALKLEMRIGENPADWNSPGVQAYFASGDGFGLLAFRGTEVDDPSDVHYDVDILLVPEAEYRGALSPRLGHLALIEHLLAPCLVHRGFQTALNRVWDQVHSAVADYRSRESGAEICVTGHSLGGALALLTYSRFADPLISVFTLGCPRVGNGGFRKRVTANPGRGHFRVVNQDDLVAHIPLESALYRHAPAGCYRFDKAGCLNYTEDDTVGVDLVILSEMLASLPEDCKTNPKVLADLPAPAGIVDHSVARYAMRVWDCV